MRAGAPVNMIIYPVVMLGVVITAIAIGDAGRAGIAIPNEYQHGSALIHEKSLLKGVMRSDEGVLDVHDISLKGVFYGENAKYASISIDSAVDKNYRQGDTLIAGVILEEIFVESVNVIVNGERRSIRLDKTLSADNMILLSEARRREREEAFVLKQLLRYEDRQSQDFKDKLLRYINSRPLSEVPYPLGTSSHGVSINSENSYSVDMASIKQQITNSDALQHARLAYTDDGVLLEDIVPGSIYDKAGLVSGDRIVSIQGESVTGAFDLLQRYYELDTQQSIDVVVNRSGEKYELKYYTY